nr:unnamed protein product [Callosobruchus analis]
MGEVSPSASRSHTIALMRFFSVDPDTEMNIQHTTSGIQVPDLADLWAREFILKIIQLVICIISLILVELTEIYFARWVYDMVILGTGGYLLILSVMLLGMLIDELSPYVELSFLLAGAIFNLLGGILMFIR